MSAWFKGVRGAIGVLLVGALAPILPGDRPLTAQAPGELLRQLDTIAATAVTRYRAVGTVAAVMRGDDTLLFKAYGKADVEWDVPMPTDAMFEIGSITKQFTAVAILQLRDEGKLGLDDDLTRWLPDFDTRGHRVTLRHLLNHTSGIHDLTETPEFPALVSNRVWPRDSAYALITRQPFDFAPGTRQQYSNSGFWLLGLVIEKASGMSYEDFVEQRLFAPLGMTRSMVCNSFESVPRRAHGYGLREGQLLRAPTNIHTWSFAAGALCSTAADLLTWLRALHGSKVLSPASYQEMMTPSPFGHGMQLRYGLGVGVEHDFEGRLVINHGGVLAGFWTEALWYPDAQLASIVLINTTGGLDPEEIARTLAERVILPVREATAAYAGDPTPFLGTFSGQTLRGPMTLEVSRGAEGLLVSGNGSPPRPLLWLGGPRFFFNGIYLAFGAPDGAGVVRELGFNPAKGMFVVLRRP